MLLAITIIPFAHLCNSTYCASRSRISIENAATRNSEWSHDSWAQIGFLRLRALRAVGLLCGRRWRGSGGILCDDLVVNLGIGPLHKGNRFLQPASADVSFVPRLNTAESDGRAPIQEQQQPHPLWVNSR